MTDDTRGAAPRTDQHSSITDDATFDAEKAREGVRLLLEAMGEDPDRPELVETWQRRGPAVYETFSRGRRAEAKPEMRTFASESNELVVKTGIPLFSLCEHHLLPFHGTAHVAYRPDGEVVGLSKLPRYIRWQSRRPTMQEELTQDIATGLESELESPAVLVEVTATHMCEAMRGVETATETTTRATVGSPTDAERRRFERAVRDAGGSR